MKVNSVKAFLFLIIISILTNCASQKYSSTIVGGEYNEVKDVTNYFVFPYGSVSLPGKWEKTNYNSISKQQFFVNQDSQIIAIAFGRYDNYEFNKDGSYSGYSFVEKFYEWDSKYFVDTYMLKRQPIVNDSINNFFIYRIFGEIEKVNIDTYYLIGEKNGNTSNFSISVSNKWTENEKINFLEKIFLTEKKE